MKFSKGLWMSAALLSLTACGQAFEVSDVGSNPVGADVATSDATDIDASHDVSMDGVSNDDGDANANANDSSSAADTAIETDAALDSGLAPLVCPPGTANCNMNEADGCETNLGTISNCSACNDACPSGPRSTPMCSSGVCRIACEPGFGDCDGDPRNGCEVDLNRSSEHCGRCANRCGAGANASPVCAGGLCGLSCNPGFADCDVSLGNGCEADLNSSVSNCGACGSVCTAPAGATATCSAGACDFRCNAGLVRCGAQCVRPDDPAFGCGTCVACARAPNAASMTCDAGRCVPATCNAGFKLCGSSCVAIDDPSFGCTATSCARCTLATGAQSMMCLGGACAVATCAAGFKFCGNACVPTNLPLYGCGSGSCLSCNPQNAAAICNSAGSCDYSTCNAGWRDLDGNRANGCETAAPSQIAGLRVWLSVNERGSLTSTNCTAHAEQQCLTRWSNLVDPANPATPTTAGTPPWVWRARGDGTAEAVMINISPVFNSGGALIGISSNRAAGRTASLGLSSIVNSQYTVYVVDAPMEVRRVYPLACRPSSVFDTNGAFHIGTESETQLRLGHYNNDVNINGSTLSLRRRLLIATQGPSGRTFTRTDSSGTVSGGDANSALLSRAVDCSMGRGLGDGAEYTGSLSEVLVFNRVLTAAEQSSVRTYLSRRYGL